MLIYSVGCYLCLAGESKLRQILLTLKKKAANVHSIRQSPQCEGFFLDRPIFGKVSDKRSTAVFYGIRSDPEGKKYVIDEGEAAGITVGAEFKVYQDQCFGHLLGTVVARELTAFSTILCAKGDFFALQQDGVALKSHPGKEEQVRVYVADEKLRDMVNKIGSNQIRLVERDHGAEFGMGLEKGKVVFINYDSEVTTRKHRLRRTAHTFDFTLEAISSVIHAAVHFYWHRRRTPKTGRGLAGKVKIEVTELQLENVDYYDLKPVVVGVYGPTTGYDRKGGKEFDLRTETAYGSKIINNCAIPLYPALFYFDNSDWSIS